MALSAAAGMSLVPCTVNLTLMWCIKRSCRAAAGEDIEARSPPDSSKVAEESPSCTYYIYSDGRLGVTAY